MPDNFTQEQIDDLTTEALSLVPFAKMKDLEADIAAKKNYPLNVQGRFLTRVIDAFEATDVDKYIDRPVINGNGSARKPDKSNPWSAAGWNVSEQGRVAKALGEAKAAALAKSAGCVLGSAKPNPHFN